MLDKSHIVSFTVENFHSFRGLASYCEGFMGLVGGYCMNDTTTKVSREFRWDAGAVRVSTTNNLHHTVLHT